jgi:hypothetical protein
MVRRLLTIGFTVAKILAISPVQKSSSRETGAS